MITPGYFLTLITCGLVGLDKEWCYNRDYVIAEAIITEFSKLIIIDQIYPFMPEKEEMQNCCIYRVRAMQNSFITLWTLEYDWLQVKHAQETEADMKSLDTSKNKAQQITSPVNFQAIKLLLVNVHPTTDYALRKSFIPDQQTG